MIESIKKNASKLKKAALATGVIAVGTSQAFALDVSSATSGSSATTDIETGAVWVLGIAVTIFAAKKVIGFFSR